MADRNRGEKSTVRIARSSLAQNGYERHRTRPVPVSSDGTLMASRSPGGDAEEIWQARKSFKTPPRLFFAREFGWLTPRKLGHRGGPELARGYQTGRPERPRHRRRFVALKKRARQPRASPLAAFCPAGQSLRSAQGFEALVMSAAAVRASCPIIQMLRSVGLSHFFATFRARYLAVLVRLSRA